MTRILGDDFFSEVLAFLELFALEVFVFGADVSVANPSVPFSTAIGVHFIFCNNSLELHLKQEQRDICHLVLRHTVQDLIHAQRMVEGQNMIDTSFFRC